MIQDLDRVGVLDSTDGPVLVTLALAWERLVLAQQVIDRQGYAAGGSTGQASLHPMLRVVAEASATILRIATEFGATAAARSRIDRERSGGQLDPFHEIGPSPRLRAIDGGAS